MSDMATEEPGDDLAETFFDSKIAPGLVEKGIEPERLATVRQQFIIDVVKARDELRTYYR